MTALIIIALFIQHINLSSATQQETTDLSRGIKAQNNNPPECDFKFTYFTEPGQSSWQIEQFYIALQVSHNSHNECFIDINDIRFLKTATSMTLKVHDSVLEMHMAFICHSSTTHILFRHTNGPDDFNPYSSHAFSRFDVVFKGCSISLQELRIWNSIVSRPIDTMVITRCRVRDWNLINSTNENTFSNKGLFVGHPNHRTDQANDQQKDHIIIYNVSIEDHPSFSLVSDNVIWQEASPQFHWYKTLLLLPNALRYPETLLNHVQVCGQLMETVDSFGYSVEAVIIGMHYLINKYDVERCENMTCFLFMGSCLNILYITNNTSPYLIHSLHHNTFRHLSVLHTLSLANNTIKELPLTIFNDLLQLRTINLQYNQLTHIHRDLFKSCPSLRRLLLDHNLLRHIQPYTFEHNPNLESLELSHNHLRQISEVAINTFHSKLLKKLNCQHNLLEKIPLWVFIVPKMEFMDFSSNLLTFEGLEETLTNLTGVHSDLNIIYSNRFKVEVGYNAFDNKVKVFLQNNSFTYLNMSKFEEVLPTLLNIMEYFHLEFDTSFLLCDCTVFPLYHYLHTGRYNYKTSRASYHQTTIGIAPEKLICRSPPVLRDKPLAPLPNTTFWCQSEGKMKNCPETCHCGQREVDGATVVDCFNQGLLSLPHNVPKKTKTIIMANNRLKMIDAYPKYIKHLDTLDLSNNKLSTFDMSLLHSNLRYLYLQENELQTLSYNTNSISKSLLIWLSGNKFKCDCQNKGLLEWIGLHKPQIVDIDQVFCDNPEMKGKLLMDIVTTDIMCPFLDRNMIYQLTVSIIFCAVSLILWCRKNLAKLFLNTDKQAMKTLRQHDEQIDGLEYDVFISYSTLDRDWVEDVLCDTLEAMNPSYTLCIHHRDFMPGKAIHDNIISSIHQSRRVIIVLSTHFLKSEWCRSEFRYALMKGLEGVGQYLIPVLYGDLNAHLMDEDLKLYLKNYTYLDHKNKHFWANLVAALPAKPLNSLRV